MRSYLIVINMKCKLKERIKVITITIADSIRNSLQIIIKDR